MGCDDKEPYTEAVDTFKSGSLAPDFELPGIDGKTYRLSDFKGKLVVLNFWATWCTPCVLEMPSLLRVHHTLRDKGLTVIAVSMDDPGKDAEVKKFAESYGLDFPVLRNSNYTVAEKYGVTGFPETFVINRKGEFVQFKDHATHKELVRILSDRPWDSVNYLNELERHLAQ